MVAVDKVADRIGIAEGIAAVESIVAEGIAVRIAEDIVVVAVVEPVDTAAVAVSAGFVFCLGYYW